jgi:hypothetical protein
MNQENVMVPMGDWAKTRLKHLGKNDVVRYDSQVNSGFGKNIANWVGREKAYPSNVLHLATETGNRIHSATFPRTLISNRPVLWAQVKFATDYCDEAGSILWEKLVKFNSGKHE